MTLRSHVDIIHSGDNVIIGLGDSFTQGVGAYSLETWASVNAPANLYNISGQHFIEEQGKNNWVRQLADNFLPGYKSMSLGVNGAGNRAAVKELYLNPLPSNVGNVVVVLMSTGLERFDFLKNEKRTSGSENHQKWRTIWPSLSSPREDIGRLEEEYAKNVWSEKVDIMEFLMNVAEAQEFCRSRNYKFVFGSAFDSRITQEYFKKHLAEDADSWLSLINWDNFIFSSGCNDFMEHIRKLENHPNVLKFHDGREYCNQLSMPLQYITPCYHWTIEGNYEIAKLLHGILKDKNIV
jgi:hypothetical protein